MGYISKNRHKFYLKCHLIFVCKYRKQLLLSDIRDIVFGLMDILYALLVKQILILLESTLKTKVDAIHPIN